MLRVELAGAAVGAVAIDEFARLDHPSPCAEGNRQGDAGGELRCFSQFFFAYDAFVQLVAIPDSVFKLAIILGQSFDDDVRACRGVLAKRRSEKNSFSDLKSVCHDTLPLNKPSRVIVHQSGQ